MPFRTITETDQFLALEPQWRALEAAGRVPNVFVTFDWLACYWRTFGKTKKLSLLVREEGGPIQSIAPLMVSRVMGTGLRRLELIGAGIHDYSDFILTTADPAQEANALWSHILDSQREWDLLRFGQLPESSPVLQTAPMKADGIASHHPPHPSSLIPHHQYHHHPSSLIPYPRPFYAELAPGESCPSLALPATWEEYEQMLGKNMRYDLRRYSRRMNNDFSDVQIRLVTDPGELDAALDALFKLHTLRWRKRGLPGVLATPSRRKFQRELAHALLKRDRLRMFVLDLDSAPAAVLLNYFHNGRVFFYIGGFDPDRERYRPGTILFGHAIRHAIEEGATEFDFLRGQEEYKYRLGARDQHYHHLQVRKNTWRSRASHAYTRIGQSIVDRARDYARKRTG